MCSGIKAQGLQWRRPGHGKYNHVTGKLPKSCSPHVSKSSPCGAGELRELFEGCRIAILSWNSCSASRYSADLGKSKPMQGKERPVMATAWPHVDKALVEIGQHLVNFGRSVSKLAKCWPQLPNIDSLLEKLRPTWAEIGSKC